MNTTTFNLNGSKLRVIWSDPLTPWFIAKDLCKAFGIEEDSFLQFVLERDKAFVVLDGQVYNIVTDFGACAALYPFTEEGAEKLRRLVCLEVLLYNEPLGGTK